MIPIIAKTIKGFPIKTKSEKAIIGKIKPEKLENISDDPKITKNTKIKKSFSGLTRLAIWKFSAELAKAKPAKNPPISMENPNFSAPEATIKSQARLVKNKSSCEWAILSKIKGKTFLPR